MENDLVAKAQALAKELAKQAQEKGFTSDFSVKKVKGGTKEGEVFVQKEKPSGEVVIYPVK